MSLLDADQLANPEPFVARRYVIEFKETPSGHWYVNQRLLRGEFGEGGSFIDRFSYAPDEAIEFAMQEIRRYFEDL